jgi:hypothetical protein
VTATSATSRASTKLTTWSPLPAYNSSSSRIALAYTASSSLKFCRSQFGRRIVHSFPEFCTARSTACRGASGSERSTLIADMSTTRRTAGADASSRAKTWPALSSLSSPLTKSASASPSAADQVVGSYQSNRTGRTPGGRLTGVATRGAHRNLRSRQRLHDPPTRLAGGALYPDAHVRT